MRLPLTIALIVACLAAAVLGGRAWITNAQAAAQTPKYATAPLRRENFARVVTATGAVQPEQIAEIGSTLSGRIAELGVDAKGRPLTFGSRVEKGAVLAKLDDVQAQLSLREAQSSLKQAQIAQQKAVFQQSTAVSRLEKAQAAAPGSLSVLELETLQNTRKLADLDADSATNAVERAEIALSVAQAQLAQTSITSPIAGEILDLRAKVGQIIGGNTLGAGLFVIASDLQRLQVWATINEVDVGSVAVGQSARFTVDAYPDRVFTGKVQAVWPNASLVSEVVSYPVIISVDEAGGLMPYLTANVQIVVERRDDALVVSEQALTWVPAVDLIEPTQREKYQAAVAAQTQSGPQGERKGVLWTPTADERVRFVEVVVGPSDGVDTVVSPIDAAEGLKVGEEFITGLRRRDSARGNGGLPFVGKKREAE